MKFDIKSIIAVVATIIVLISIIICFSTSYSNSSSTTEDSKGSHIVQPIDKHIGDNDPNIAEGTNSSIIEDVSSSSVESDNVVVPDPVVAEEVVEEVVVSDEDIVVPDPVVAEEVVAEEVVEEVVVSDEDIVESNFNIYAASQGGQQEIDLCIGFINHTEVSNYFYGLPYLAAHNYCGGDIVLDMQDGDIVDIDGIIDANYKVVGSVDVQQGDFAHVLPEGYDAYLQTCYYNSNFMRVVLLETV